MSAFTDSALLKKLSELNSSQQSIQTLSLWLIHHRKHHVPIVKTWKRELFNVSESKKLTFMYLANDVIQNSKKKGPEYGKEFSNALPKVFAHIGEVCHSEKLLGSLGRILNIWEERGVYEAKTITEYRTRLHRKASGGGGGEGTSEASSTGDKVNQSNGASSAAAVVSVEAVQKTASGGEQKEKSEKSERREKRKTEREHERHSKTKRSRSGHNNHHGGGSNGGGIGSASTAGDEAASSIEISVGLENGHLSPYLPHGEAPEPEELIKALQSLENAASSDAAVREQIAKLPPEISEVACLNKLEDKDKAKKLSTQVSEAVTLLNDYNTRLASELEERSKLALMLRDFHAEQKQLLAQAEQRLEEHKKKLGKLVAIQKDIKDHLSNLPDLTQLPDVTGGLAPLPSAGDLFNIH